MSDTSIYRFSVQTLDGEEKSLSDFSGKVLMIVNTASACGFTPQLKDLAQLKTQFKDQPIEILAFPSNDFGQQEPGSNKEIADFCKNTYDVKFPMFAKTAVTGKNINPLFKMLVAQTGTTPKWNFYKYVIDRNGKVVDSFNSMTKPDSKSITSEVEKLLKEKVL